MNGQIHLLCSDNTETCVLNIGLDIIENSKRMSLIDNIDFNSIYKI